MKKQEFKININAPRNTVWDVLWNDKTYRQWTSVYHEGSHAISDWKEGSEILFLGPDDKGGNGGMYSVIDKRVDNEYMAFKHLGEIKDGVKQPESNWSGAMETYTLKDAEGGTELTLGMDMTDEFAEYFAETSPKALALVKQIAESPEAKQVTVEAVVNAPVEQVWNFWTKPEHITKWNNASDDWHTPRAENDLRTGGKFTTRMEAKDGSFGFDFYGVYDDVKPNEKIAYTMGDGRKVDIKFIPTGNGTKVVETFETENMHSVEMQRGGWQAILNNFKKYTEGNKN